VRAGIGPGDEIRIEEFPPRARFSLPEGIPGLAVAERWLGAVPAVSEGDAEDYDLLYLRALLDSPGEPELLIPPGDLPAGWAAP